MDRRCLSKLCSRKQEVADLHHGVYESFSRVICDRRWHLRYRHWSTDLCGRIQLVWSLAWRHSLRRRARAFLCSYRLDVACLAGTESNFLSASTVLLNSSTEYSNLCVGICSCEWTTQPSEFAGWEGGSRLVSSFGKFKAPPLNLECQCLSLSLEPQP
jgi:hypothetical protein